MTTITSLLTNLSARMIPYPGVTWHNGGAVMVALGVLAGLILVVGVILAIHDSGRER